MTDTTSRDDSWLSKVPRWVAPAALLLLPLLAASAAAANPGFYDQVIWKYYWGPIKADAHDFTSMCLQSGQAIGAGADGYAACVDAGGVVARSGYNVVNTVSWMALLALCLVATAQMLRAHGASMTSGLVVGATLWTVAGSIVHVLEDAGLILPPLRYAFITPPIYLLFAAGGITAFLAGSHAMQPSWKRLLPAAFFAAPPALGVALWITRPGLFAAYLHPAVWIAVWGLAWLLWRAWRERRGAQPAALVIAGGAAAIATSLAFVVQYLVRPWSEFGGGFPSAILLAPGLAAGATFVAWAVARAQTRKQGRAVEHAEVPAEARPALWAGLLAPMGLLVVFSQMLDAFATALAIDFYGYGEKHVLSARVIEWARGFAQTTGWDWGAAHATTIGFVPLKFAVSLAAVAALHPRPGQDGNLVGLARFAIIMVGIGPGVRDALRLSLGI